MIEQELDDVVCKYLDRQTQYWKQLNYMEKIDANLSTRDWLHKVFEEDLPNGEVYWQVYCTVTGQQGLEYEIFKGAIK